MSLWASRGRLVTWSQGTLRILSHVHAQPHGVSVDGTYLNEPYLADTTHCVCVCFSLLEFVLWIQSEFGFSQVERPLLHSEKSERHWPRSSWYGNTLITSKQEVVILELNMNWREPENRALKLSHIPCSNMETISWCFLKSGLGHVERPTASLELGFAVEVNEDWEGSSKVQRYLPYLWGYRTQKCLRGCRGCHALRRRWVWHKA